MLAEPEAPAQSASRVPSFSEALRTYRTPQGTFPEWDYLHDFAAHLQSGRDILALKRRQILISWAVAAYFHDYMKSHPYSHGAIISAGRVAAARQGWRIVTLARLDGYDIRGKEMITYPNGADITIFPSTEHAGVGESLDLAHFDEYDFHPYGRQNLATITPAVSNSGGQTIITSTANPEFGDTGPFAEAWAGDSDYERLFYGKWVRPDQGPESDFWQREARKPGMSEAVMRAYYPETPEQAFVTPTGLVYPQFGEAHLRDGDPVRWEDCIARYAGYDLGGGDPTAQLAIGAYRNRDGAPRVHVFGEFYKTNGAPSPQELFTWEWEWHQRAPLASIEADSAPGGAVVAEGIRAMFDRKVQVRAEQSSRFEGLSNVAQFLEAGWLTVNAKACPNLVREFGSYRWLTRVDPNSKDRYATATPHDHHGDALDTLRRILLRVFTDLWNRRDEPRRPREVRL